MPYFTTDELRALPDIDDTTRFPDDRLVEAHDWIAGIVERECETSFIDRTHTDRLSGGRDSLFLTDPYAHTLTSLSVDGVSANVDTAVIDYGALYLVDGTCWATGRGNVSATYVASYADAPSADLKQAMLRGARNWLLTMDTWSGADSRSTSISNEYGNINMSVAGPDGAPTGIPDVDATITKWARKVRVPKVR